MEMSEKRVVEATLQKDHMETIGVKKYLENNPTAGDMIQTAFGSLKVYRLNRALIYGDPPLISPGTDTFQMATRVLDESTTYPHTQMVIDMNSRAVVEPLAQHKNCTILADVWSKGFFHWMLEALPKVIILESTGFKGTYFVPHGGTFIKESLEYLDISSDRVAHCSGPFTVEDCFVTDKFPHHQLAHHPEIMEMLRTKLLNKIHGRPPEQTTRIYIQRSHSRRILNEYDLFKLISSYNFNVLSMENLILKEQIRYMSGADFLISPHGAGIVHALFMKPGSIIVELFSSKHINPCCLHIMSKLNHRYYMVAEHLNRAPSPFSPNYFKNNWLAHIKANLPVLKHVLEHELKS